MSLAARAELKRSIYERYHHAPRKEKIRILDEFIATTGYQRKYAIALLNGKIAIKETRIRSRGLVKYDTAVQEALVTLWSAANQICTKRLVPFLPELISSLERCGRLSLNAEVRKKLLTLSPATADRLLKDKRRGIKPHGIPTTKPAGLLKKQIPIRTFADWDDKSPGFLEADLVAHCGDRVDGTFLNTLVLTDIGSTWTEFIPLLYRSEENVIAGLTTAQDLFPFPWKGLDTDNGGEFINYKLLSFCKTHRITFTRSRAYRKNDQAHVEEKNGSIVRRLIGYDRYEGERSWKALSELYSVLRLYSNFFQPCMKLLSKQRHDSKVKKVYDTAKTPYQRLLASTHISEKIKHELQKKYESLDPLYLLKELERLQKQLWQYAWQDLKVPYVPIKQLPAAKPIETQDIQALEKEQEIQQPISIQRYRRTRKPIKPFKGPRTWRSCPDPFETVQEQLKLNLRLNPTQTAKGLLLSLIEESPQQFSIKHLRTLQRRVKEWRIELSEHETNKRDHGKFTTFLTLAATAAK
jgi:hypothetical protein